METTWSICTHKIEIELFFRTLLLRSLFKLCSTQCYTIFLSLSSQLLFLLFRGVVSLRESQGPECIQIPQCPTVEAPLLR